MQKKYIKIMYKMIHNKYIKTMYKMIHKKYIKQFKSPITYKVNILQAYIIQKQCFPHQHLSLMMLTPKPLHTYLILLDFSD